MSFFQDIFGGAKKILDDGKKSLSNLGSDVVVTRDPNTGQVSSEFVKGTDIGSKTKDFFLPGRGFSDEQISAAQPTFKDKLVGAGKTAGEIGAGISFLSRRGLDLIPGIDFDEAEIARNPILRSITEPSSPEEAKVMRAIDYAGFAPVGSIKHFGKANKLNVVKNQFAPSAQRFSIVPGQTNLTPKLAADVSKNSVYHGTSLGNALDIIDSGFVSRRISNLDKAGDNAVSLSRNKHVSSSFGDVVFEFDTKRVPVKDAPSGTTKGDIFNGFEVRTNKDLPIEDIKTAHIILDGKEAGRSGFDFPIKKVNRSGGETVIEEVGTAKDLIKKFEDKGINVVIHTDDPDLLKNPVGQFERSFSQRVDRMVPDADVNVETFTARNTDELAARARAIISEDPNKTQSIVDKIKAGDVLDEDSVAVGSELLKDLTREFTDATDDIARNSINDRINDLAVPLAAQLTEQGRAIQAASILTRQTPEGMIRDAIRKINAYNAKVTNPSKRIDGLTPEQTKFITEEMTEIKKMPEGTDKAERMFKLQGYVSDLIPSSLPQKVANVWRAGLLTGIKTSGLNIASTAAHSGTEILKDIPAAAVDSVASLFTGKRTKTLNVAGSGRGFKEGFQKGARYWKTGFDERNVGAKLDYNRVNYGKGPAAKAFQTYTDTVFRTIGAQDQVFYYGASARSIMDQAKAQAKNAGLRGDDFVKYVDELVQNPTEEMLRYANLDATTAVFQNKTQLGKAAKTIQNIPGVGYFVVPFAQTPSAVAMQIINYSPVGIVKTIIENIGKGRFDQRLFSQGIGRGIVGTAPLAIGAELYKNGLVALDYPAGDERQIELDKERGVNYNSIKMGDDWRSVITLGPVGNLVLMGAYFQKALEESGSPSEAMAQAGAGAVNSFTEQTFVTGARDFINVVTDPERYAGSYLPNLTASFIPTIVSDVARAGDPQERVTTGEDFWETFQTKAQARTPGLRNELEPVITAFGTQDPRAAGPITSMIDPTRPSESRETALTAELQRLQDAGYKASPTKLGNKKGYESLSQEQNTQLWEIVGTLVNDKLSNLVEHPKYQAMDDDKKAENIKKVVDKAKIVGRAQYVLILTEGLPREERIEVLKALKADKLLTEQVFKEYEKLLSE